MILDVRPDRVKWAVGTTGFIAIEPPDKSRFKHIKKLEIAAATDTRDRDRLVQWDLLEVTFFCDGHGYFETFSSPCLPRVASHQHLPIRGVGYQRRCAAG